MDKIVERTETHHTTFMYKIERIVHTYNYVYHNTVGE